MQPDDLIVRMLRENETVILFDRDNDIQQKAKSIGYELLECTSASSPIGNTAVIIALLRATTEAERKLLSPDVRASQPSFVRLLDRFFIPQGGDPVISALFFQLIADRYEELTVRDVNRSTADILLRAALNELSGGQQKVLDFGCGTGFAIDALKVLGHEEQDVELIGTDLSEAMLSIARGRGETVVSLQEWRTMPANAFFAAISCFVLHYGVAEDDLANIARQLKPGGIFSANLFKGDETSLTQITGNLRKSGLDLISNKQLSTTPDTYNRHLIFKKQNDWQAT